MRKIEKIVSAEQGVAGKYYRSYQDAGACIVTPKQEADGTWYWAGAGTEVENNKVDIGNGDLREIEQYTEVYDNF